MPQMKKLMCPEQVTQNVKLYEKSKNFLKGQSKNRNSTVKGTLFKGTSIVSFTRGIETVKPAETKEQILQNKLKHFTKKLFNTFEMSPQASEILVQNALQTLIGNSLTTLSPPVIRPKGNYLVKKGVGVQPNRGGRDFTIIPIPQNKQYFGTIEDNNLLGSYREMLMGNKCHMIQRPGQVQSSNIKNLKNTLSESENVKEIFELLHNPKKYEEFYRRFHENRIFEESIPSKKINKGKLLEGVKGKGMKTPEVEEFAEVVGTVPLTSPKVASAHATLNRDTCFMPSTNNCNFYYSNANMGQHCAPTSPPGTSQHLNMNINYLESTNSEKCLRHKVRPKKRKRPLILPVNIQKMPIFIMEAPKKELYKNHGLFDSTDSLKKRFNSKTRRESEDFPKDKRGSLKKESSLIGVDYDSERTHPFSIIQVDIYNIYIYIYIY